MIALLGEITVMTRGWGCWIDSQDKGTFLVGLADYWVGFPLLNNNTIAL
jgi:hypothetical protein